MIDLINLEIIKEALGYTPAKIQGIERVDSVGTRTIVLLNEDNTVRAYWNVFEFANKCKEDAYSKGYILLSGRLGNNWICEISTLKHYEINGMCNKGLGGYGLNDDIDTSSDNEADAILKAYKWILKK